MKKKYTILVIGSGAREHSICDKLSQSKQVKNIFITNHSAIEKITKKIKSIPIKDTQIDDLVKFAKENNIDFSVVGPEIALSLGIVDTFKKAGLSIIGPTQKAAQLESSKSFAKNLMEKYHIPTAKFAIFTDTQKAIVYLQKQNFPVVIKADGLAAGKGVMICDNLEQAKQTVINMLENLQFNQASKKIVIEQFLLGQEASFMLMVDQKGNIINLASSQDHKRLLDGDLGPNTGGMGAYCPAPIVDESVSKKVMAQIVKPTIAAMQKEKYPFFGFLYVGLMIDKDKNPYVVEFNTRLGDPETQPVLLRIKNKKSHDFFSLCLTYLKQDLANFTLAWRKKSAICVVLASKGYPQSSTQESIIKGIKKINSLKKQEKVRLFLAACKYENKQFLTSGGRVLSICVLADDITTAQKKVYQMIKKIKCKDLIYRSDIGFRAVKNNN